MKNFNVQIFINADTVSRRTENKREKLFLLCAIEDLIFWLLIFLFDKCAKWLEMERFVNMSFNNAGMLFGLADGIS